MAQVNATTLAPDFASATIGDALAAMGVDPGIGLSNALVQKRKDAYGHNEVVETKTHPALDLLRHYWGISAWMLELIIILSAVLKKYPDMIVVSALLIINATVGFVQQRRAASVVQALRRRLQVSARVLRESVWLIIPSRDLVPGDIVRLRGGDIIPADIKQLTGNMSVDQSALTGESAEVDKVPGDVLSSGSLVRRGEGNGVVMLTGPRTRFGRTIQLVQQARHKLHIEEVVTKVVRWLFLIVGILICVVAVLSLMRGTALVILVPLVLVLLMSAVPVGLPVMFTVSMAYGSRDLAKLGVLVTRLSAAEDAATMDVLCVDKTGTITMNQLAISQVIPWGTATQSEVIACAALASQESNQDPIDLAFLAASKRPEMPAQEIGNKTISFLPFDAKTRRTEAVIECAGQQIRVMKGAVRTIAEACGMQSADIQALEQRVSDSARKGERTLAVAHGPISGTITLLGLVTMSDPLRPDAKQLIIALHDLGISVKMLTGDAMAVAREIGRRVGLPAIHSVAELKPASGHDPLRISTMLDGTDGFAEVYPEDKYLVVQSLQAARHVTGMTGDGVNDAPALRAAEVGIAVSTATDIAKSAASVVLTQPGLANIVALVVQGRTIYQRVLTYIINKISRTILKASFVTIAYIITGRFVVSAFSMLLLVFMTDFAKIALATDGVRPSRNPERWEIGGFIIVSMILGVAMVAESLLFLWFSWSRFELGADNAALYTFSFLTLLYFALFSILSARERLWFWYTRPSWTLMSALAVEGIIGTALIFVGLPDLMPLPWWQMLTIAGFALVTGLIVNDLLKVMLIRWLVPSAAQEQARRIAMP